MSQITTHVLDTSSGKPADGIKVNLYSTDTASLTSIAEGITNKDGRVGDLLPPGKLLKKGIYKIKFETGQYFKKMDAKNFYPYVVIVFEIEDEAHYHIPLLLNPFGYTTYRGS